MLTRLILPLATTALWLSMQGQSLAQYRTDLVCWANDEQVSGCPQKYRTIVYHCGSGGHSGFNPDWVCCMSSEHFGQLAWQFESMSGSSGLKVQAAIAC